MNAEWSETVEAIRRVDPNNVVVRQWDGTERRNGSTRVSNADKEELGRVPEGLTHRAVWNASEREQCWVCQVYHSKPGTARGIVYVCPYCNPGGDLRATLTYHGEVDDTVCPHCWSAQSADRTRWWRNPPLDRETVRRARERCRRRENAGVGIPRAPCGDDWHPPPSNIDLPYLKGITDPQGNVISGKPKKAVISALRGQLKEEARAAAGQGGPAAVASEGRTGGAFGDAPWRDHGGSSQGWWSRDRRDDGESYDRRQQFMA